MSDLSALHAPFVLVTGGKGGVGKTTLAASLAVRLRARGLRTLLCDLDLGLADLHVLLGLEPRYTIEHALAGECTLADCVVSGPGGIDVLVGSNGSAALARLASDTRAYLLDGLAGLSTGYDVVVGDSAAGIGPDVLAFGALARMVLVVTTPDPSAAADAYGLVKARVAERTARGLDLPTPELVLNQVSGAREAELAAARLAQVCQRFLLRSPRLAGWVPRTPRIQEAARRRVPFVEVHGSAGAGSGERECLERLAQRVVLGLGMESASSAVGRNRAQDWSCS